MAQSPVRGLRGRVWNRIEGPLERRTPFSAETLRAHSPEGRMWHAELRLGDSTVFLGEPGGGYVSPRRAGGTTVSLYCSVDDVDEHFARARDAGAEIVSPPSDQSYGDRRYHAKDPEGHEFFFAQRVREVPPEEWGAEPAA